MKWLRGLWKKFISFFIHHKVIFVSGSITEEEVSFNIKRFELALEQCDNLEKKSELKSNLKYWVSVKEAFTTNGVK